MNRAPDRLRLCSLSMLPPEKADTGALTVLRALPHPDALAPAQELSEMTTPLRRQAGPCKPRSDLPRPFPHREALLSAGERRVGEFFLIPAKGGEKT